MANSQFIIYKSTDANAPIIDGLTGSLLTTLDKILIYGYGTMPGAGWIKPMPNIGNGSGSVGCIQMPSGSAGVFYHIVDNGPSGAAGQEARLTGWDYVVTMSNGNITGSNQWPTSTQIANGMVLSRKSTAATATTRSWIAFADSRSIYMNILSGDSAGFYCSFMLGELYSLKRNGVDTNRAMIAGRISENNSLTTNERLDKFTLFGTATDAHFISRNHGGTGTGITAGKTGDYSKTDGGLVYFGDVPYPNPTDGATYLSRVYVHEPTTLNTRGYMRGFWHFCHAIASVTDRFEFSGSGNLSGRTFMILKQTGNSGVYCMETSATVETN